ncbi:MAG: hypothetical protein QXH71_01395 [Candidatus Anstonellaceae archaeon]
MVLRSKHIEIDEKEIERQKKEIIVNEIKNPFNIKEEKVSRLLDEYINGRENVGEKIKFLAYLLQIPSLDEQEKLKDKIKKYLIGQINYLSEKDTSMSAKDKINILKDLISQQKLLEDPAIYKTIQKALSEQIKYVETEENFLKSLLEFLEKIGPYALAILAAFAAGAGGGKIQNIKGRTAEEVSGVKNSRLPEDKEIVRKIEKTSQHNITAANNVIPEPQVQKITLTNLKNQEVFLNEEVIFDILVERGSDGLIKILKKLKSNSTKVTLNLPDEIGDKEFDYKLKTLRKYLEKNTSHFKISDSKHPKESQLELNSKELSFILGEISLFSIGLFDKIIEYVRTNYKNKHNIDFQKILIEKFGFVGPDGHGQKKVEGNKIDIGEGKKIDCTWGRIHTEEKGGEITYAFFIENKTGKMYIFKLSRAEWEYSFQKKVRKNQINIMKLLENSLPRELYYNIELNEYKAILYDQI